MHRFSNALAEYRDSKARIEALGGASESTVEAEVERHSEALAGLMAAPALTIEALSLKIEIAISEAPVPGGGGVIEAPCAAAILRDAQALAAAA